MDPAARLGHGSEGWRSVQSHPWLRGVDFGLVEARVLPAVAAPAYTIATDWTTVPDKVRSAVVCGMSLQRQGRFRRARRRAIRGGASVTPIPPHPTTPATPQIENQHKGAAAEEAAAEEARARAAAATVILTGEDEGIFAACTFTSGDLFKRGWLRFAATRSVSAILATPIGGVCPPAAPPAFPRLAPAVLGGSRAGSRMSAGADAGGDTGRRRSASDAGVVRVPLAPGAAPGALNGGFPLPVALRAVSAVDGGDAMDMTEAGGLATGRAVAGGGAPLRPAFRGSAAAAPGAPAPAASAAGRPPLPVPGPRAAGFPGAVAPPGSRAASRMTH